MHEFIPLTVTDVRRETQDAVVIVLAVPPGDADHFRHRPGQHLALRATLAGEEVRRTYSICSVPGAADLAIAVKRIAGGVFSSWANDALRPGMTLESMPPQGRFVLPDDPGARGHVLAFAAGAGITPLIAMAETALVRRPGQRFTLIYGNRDRDSIMFRERLEALKDAHLDRFTLLHVLSRDAESETPLLSGRIDAGKVAALARHVVPLEDVDDIFLCGPGSMIRDVRKALFDLGVARERVHHEFFAAGGGAYRGGAQAPAAAPALIREGAAASVEVVAILDGRHHSFTARPGEAIVDAALRAGIGAPYSCKGGMCSTCRGLVVEGRAPMAVNYSLEPWELERGFVLACQAVPLGSRVVIDFDQM